MQKTRKIIPFILAVPILLVFFIIIKNSSNPKESVQNLINSPEVTVQNATFTLTPSQIAKAQTTTPTLEVPASPTSSSTPTLDSSKISLISYDAVYNTSSQFQVDMTITEGKYYASGRLQNGNLISFSCDFRKDKPTYLVCSSGPLPFDSQVNFQLYDKSTNKLLFSQVILYNFVLHGEVIPSPTGVICEGEPQWNGKIPPHQLAIGCFAMSCWQNGTYLWGTDNTCEVPWPFPWAYSHPLNLPNP